MKKILITLFIIALFPLVASLGDVLNIIASDGTTTINGTDVCLDDGTCLRALAGNITDTNASTACDGAEYLAGNGSCVNISVGAGTGKAGDGTYLFNDSTTMFFNTTLADQNLSVNKSDFWDDFNIVNASQFLQQATLSINLTWFSNLFDTLFGAKDTDDLSEGTTNLYDNQSWNQSLADNTYLNLSGTNADQNIDIGVFNLTTTGWFTPSNFRATSYYSTGNNLRFNFYDDGTDLFMNVSDGGGNFFIEQENTKLGLFNSPVVANDFKVFQVFSKEASDVTEFVVTKAGEAHTSYFARSLALVGNGTQIPTPFNCSTYTNFIDCDTDSTGSDFYVLDDVEINGSLFVGNGNFNVTDDGNVSANFYFGDGSQLSNLPSGDNSSWNQSLADTLYYNISNPFGFFNSTNPQTETDPLWSDNDTTVGRIGNCTSGQFVQNVTTVGVQCAAPSGSGDITSVQGDDVWIYNGSDSGDVILAFNDTLLNLTIDDRATPDNTSWNETHANTLYYLISNPFSFFNSTTLQNLSQLNDDLGHVEDNSSWNQSLADTLYADISVTGDNSSWNETHANTLYISQANEGNLNVNRSNFWDNFNTTNSSQFEGTSILTINMTWFSNLFDTLFGTKDTDDLSEGTTNLYDNQSWNESFANSKYYTSDDNITAVPASKITAGTFGAGNYNMTGNFTVANELNIKDWNSSFWCIGVC